MIDQAEPPLYTSALAFIVISTKISSAGLHVFLVKLELWIVELWIGEFKSMFYNCLLKVSSCSNILEVQK